MSQNTRECGLYCDDEMRGVRLIAEWRLAMMRAAQTLRSKGSVAGLANLVPYAELNGVFLTNISAQHARDDQCGRSESVDPENVGDIADEGVGHRG